jgi:hypothetical protein
MGNLILVIGMILAAIGFFTGNENFYVIGFFLCVIGSFISVFLKKKK